MKRVLFRGRWWEAVKRGAVKREMGVGVGCSLSSDTVTFIKGYTFYNCLTGLRGYIEDWTYQTFTCKL